MSRLSWLFLLLLICLLSCALLNVEAKSREKDKEKHNKKYSKAEGSPKEAKRKYSKNSQETEEYARKYKKQENLEPINQEDEPQEIPKKQEPIQKSNKQKKEKKNPYTISVEILEEPEVNDLKDDNKISKEDNSESNVYNEVKQKATKRHGYQNVKKSQTPKATAEDTADFIVHVPKHKKGTRQVLIFQVPAQDEQNEEEGELENAVQQYVDEQDATVEEDCGCEENAEEQSIPNKKSSNMCYY